MKRRNTQGITQSTAEPVEQQLVDESSPPSSQLSALLFSSPVRDNPPPAKQSKLDLFGDGGFMSCGEGDEGELADLLKELDEVEEMERVRDTTAEPELQGVEVKESPSLRESASVREPVNFRESASLRESLNLQAKSEESAGLYSQSTESINFQSQLTEPAPLSGYKNHSTRYTGSAQVPTVAYCTEQTKIEYSPVDSLYVVSRNNLLPLIDISTPQAFSQKPPKIEFDEEGGGGGVSGVSSSLERGHRLMLPETFDIEDLKHNLRNINGSLHLNPIEAIRASPERRVTFLLGLMLRDFRQIGPMAQLRLIDGSGNEIVGSLAFGVCREMKMKLHFGLIMILSEVTRDVIYAVY